VNKLQAVGVILLLLGLLILFVFRGPLYAFIVVVLNLIGILAGILLVVVGVALILGGGWARRRERQGGGRLRL
jgi:predicted tellurium resistance membrane protein TerC